MAVPSLRGLLVISYILAAADIICWVVIASLGTTQFSDEALVWSAYVIGPTWSLLAGAVLLHYRKRGLWILIGLPFALLGDAWFALLLVACSSGKSCL